MDFDKLEKIFLDNNISPNEAEVIVLQAKQFEELMMMYKCAIREVKTKLEVLNDEFSVKYKRNPIEFIKDRIKEPMSIVDKLRRDNNEISIPSIMYNLNDVAGIRVICSFIDDIYDVANMLTKQDDIKLIKMKDFIKNPKDNGYRSLHLIVEVPVFFSDRKQPMKVEVQIRTIAMDFWASLEHKLKYKKDIKECQLISEELKQCADVISSTDNKMQEIKYRIDEN